MKNRLHESPGRMRSLANILPYRLTSERARVLREKASFALRRYWDKRAMERALGTNRERAPRLNSAQAARIIADLTARVSALEARWAQLGARMIPQRGPQAPCRSEAWRRPARAVVTLPGGAAYPRAVGGAKPSWEASGPQTGCADSGSLSTPSPGSAPDAPVTSRPG